jgi:hypothetical protein
VADQALGDGAVAEVGSGRSKPLAVVMAAKARLGHRGGSRDDDQSDKTAAEEKKKTTITAESFDRQVAHKMGRFFGEVFLPTMEKLVEAGLSYDEVKRLVKIPGIWGAKITGEQFKERAKEHLGGSGVGSSE